MLSLIQDQGVARPAKAGEGDRFGMSSVSLSPGGADAMGKRDSGPQEVIASSPMSLRQIVLVSLCIALNALDGFDVLSISFASPGIAAEWHIDRTALGVVLSMELIGMTVGSLVLGRVTDRIGRRYTTLACLIIMAAGMACASVANSVSMLSIVRLVTGFGIGGMLAATNAIVAETSNRRRRDLSVSLMAGGYPIGAIVGGAIATSLLSNGASWRSIFEIGACAAIILLPLVFFLMPETVAFLDERRPKNFQARIDATLRQFGHPPTPVAATRTTKEPRRWQDLLGTSQRATTILLTVAYLAHIMTFYFILKWIPKIVVDMGFAPAAAGGVLVWANIGGAFGALLLSLTSQRVPIRTLCVIAMLASAVMVVLFGSSGTTLPRLSTVAALAGFCTNAGVVGLYALMAKGFPAELRGAGTGFVIGFGRGGSALAPVVAGFLFSLGASLEAVSIAMAAGSLVAACALIALRRKMVAY